jgi:hypothetical protein
MHIIEHWFGHCVFSAILAIVIGDSAAGSSLGLLLATDVLL